MQIRLVSLDTPNNLCLKEAFSSLLGCNQTQLLGCGTCPIGGAKLDEKRTKQLRQRVLSSQIGLFYPSA